MPDRASRGDLQEEFLRLFSRDSNRIFGFVLTLVMSHADAEEVFQNTCVVLWKKFDSYDLQGSFFHWACQIAHFEVLQLRRKNKRIQLLSEPALSALANCAFEAASTADSRRYALEHCLEMLPDEQRELVQLRYHQQVSPKEIAARASRSVYSIYRALGRLHARLLDCVTMQLAAEQERS